MGSNNAPLVHNANEDAELLEVQAEFYKHIFAYGDSLVLRSAIELRIPDIIHSHGQPMTLLEIASKIEPQTLNIPRLARVMRMLVRKKVFTIDYNNNQSSEEEPQPLYGLTTLSKWLVHDKDLSLAPISLLLTDQTFTKSWYEISHSITENGTPFDMANGKSLWEMASKDPKFNNLFNAGMASCTKPTLDAIVKGYKDGFNKLEGSLIDVGGGIGRLITKIVEAYPHIKGINFDLPHAVATAPKHPCVTQIGGDMFKEVPSADNVILKSVLHDWSDEECIAILKNCQKAVSEKKGKVLIVEVVLHPDRYDTFDDAAIALDMLMMMNCDGGKERTEGEWNKLLKQAGFTHFNIIPLQTSMSFSIIEAFHL